jgi:hypothetical protein
MTHFLRFPDNCGPFQDRGSLHAGRRGLFLLEKKFALLVIFKKTVQNPDFLRFFALSWVNNGH